MLLATLAEGEGPGAQREDASEHISSTVIEVNRRFPLYASKSSKVVVITVAVVESSYTPRVALEPVHGEGVGEASLSNHCVPQVRV